MIYNLPSPKKIIMPIKGDLINLDLDGQGAKQYRVLSMDGNVAQVMAMYDTLTSKYNATSTTTTMGSLTVQKYEGSTLDTYLNTTWYNTLTDTAKAAIVPESVVCDAWYWGNAGDPDYAGTYGNSVPGTSNYTISKYAGGTLNIGERNVFALGVQDVIDYLNDSSVQVDTTAILRNVNIWKMFWNDEVSHSGKYLWLRSSNADDSNSAWYVDGGNGYLDIYSVRISYVVRPALNLNLSQIEFTLVQAPPVTETETWIIKDTAPVSEDYYTLSKQTISFTSNGETFTGLGLETDGYVINLFYYGTVSSSNKLAAAFAPPDGETSFYWSEEDSVYKTITFNESPTGDLLTWLQANATKQ